MKKKQWINNIKVGLFVILGAVMLTLLIFSIGSKDKILKNKTRVSVIFREVSGLKKGSDVRYSGVEVGVIHDIKILSDTSIKVIMNIESKYARFIRKDSEATIRTEGVVGGSYIGISPGSSVSPFVNDGDIIASREGFSLDNMIVLLNETGNNTRNITEKLKSIADKIDSSEGTLNAILTDKKLKDNITGIAAEFRKTGNNTRNISDNLLNLPDKVNAATDKLVSITDSFQIVSKNTISVTKKLEEFTENLNNKNNTLGKIVSDSVFAYKVEETLESVDSTARDVQATSEKVRGSFLIRMFNKEKDGNR
jgi:phospholipid/cholesterol/gamma-HCH transport system substrate-binding protein